MNAKVKIKMGVVEVEYEGEQKFLESGLEKLLKCAVDICNEGNFAEPPTTSNNCQLQQHAVAQITPQNNKSADDFAKLYNVKSAQEMIRASCAYLHFSKNSCEFTTSKISSAMSEATTYYDKKYKGNLTKSIRSLVKKDFLRAPSPKTYALTQRAVAEVEGLLGQ